MSKQQKEGVITRYISATMNHAATEQIKDGVWLATIQWPRKEKDSNSSVVWADGKTEEEAIATLQEVLEEWIVFSLRDNDKLPVFDGVHLNYFYEASMLKFMEDKLYTLRKKMEQLVRLVRLLDMICEVFDVHEYPEIEAIPFIEQARKEIRELKREGIRI